MTSKINNAVRPEHTVRTVVATEEQQLLEQLQARAAKEEGSSIILPALFMLF